MFNLITRIFFSLFICTLLASCSMMIELNKVEQSSQAKLTTIDNRAPEERIYRRDGPLTPISYLGDANFSLPPLQQFSNLLSNELPPGNFIFDVKKFRMIDVFPRRMNTGIAGGVGGILGVLIAPIPENEDNITCMVSGQLQEKHIDFAISEIYQLSPFAGLVANDPNFKSAVNNCLKRLAHRVAEDEKR